jgi:hypothetical protein
MVIKAAAALKKMKNLRNKENSTEGNFLDVSKKLEGQETKGHQKLLNQIFQRRI